MAPSSLALRSHPQPPTQVGGLGMLRQQVQLYSLTFSVPSWFLLAPSQSAQSPYSKNHVPLFLPPFLENTTSLRLCGCVLEGCPRRAYAHGLLKPLQQ